MLRPTEWMDGYWDGRRHDFDPDKKHDPLYVEGFAAGEKEQTHVESLGERTRLAEALEFCDACEDYTELDSRTDFS